MQQYAYGGRCVAATQGLWGVSPEQVQQLGVGAPWVQAAAEARSAFRQSLLAGGSAGAGAELAARLSNGTLLPRLLSSGMPLKLSADGARAWNYSLAQLLQQHATGQLHV